MRQIDCIVPAVCGVAGITNPTPGMNLFVQTMYGRQIWATPSGFVTPSPLARGLGVGWWAPGSCVVVGDGGTGPAAPRDRHDVGDPWTPEVRRGARVTRDEAAVSRPRFAVRSRAGWRPHRRRSRCGPRCPTFADT